MPHLQIEGVEKRFGRFLALDAVDLSVEAGELVVLLGPSGCGKTTLLRIVAGLERQERGRVVHAGRDISRLAPSERDYGIVFQSYALFPNLTVAANVAYGLRSRGLARRASAQRVQEMLDLVGLPGSDAKYPAQLSGGQQQRIALARALACAPDLLLLDEPLSALDALERVRLRAEIKHLQRRLGVTTLMVTHDQEEALALADRMVVMQDGRIHQVGSPRSIYRQPANAFVADFIGRSNRLLCTRVGPAHVRCGNLLLQTADGVPAAPADLPYHVRPEDIELRHATEGGANGCYAQVRKCEFLGAYTLVTLALLEAHGQTLLAQFSSNYLDGRELTPGALVRIGIPPHSLQALAGARA